MLYLSFLILHEEPILTQVTMKCVPLSSSSYSSFGMSAINTDSLPHEMLDFITCIIHQQDSSQLPLPPPLQTLVQKETNCFVLLNLSVIFE